MDRVSVTEVMIDSYICRLLAVIWSDGQEVTGCQRNTVSSCFHAPDREGSVLRRRYGFFPGLFSVVQTTVEDLVSFLCRKVRTCSRKGTATCKNNLARPARVYTICWSGSEWSSEYVDILF